MARPGISRFTIRGSLASMSPSTKGPSPPRPAIPRSWARIRRFNQTDDDLVHRRPDLRHGVELRAWTRRVGIHRRRGDEGPVRALCLGPMGRQSEPARWVVSHGAARNAQLRILLLPRAQSIRARASVLPARMVGALRQSRFRLSLPDTKPKGREGIFQHHDLSQYLFPFTIGRYGTKPVGIAKSYSGNIFNQNWYPI